MQRPGGQRHHGAGEGVQGATAPGVLASRECGGATLSRDEHLPEVLGCGLPSARICGESAPGPSLSTERPSLALSASFVPDPWDFGTLLLRAFNFYTSSC